MDSQYVKGSETLLKSARQCFSDIFWSLSEKISPFNSFLEVSEILRLFVSILTTENKYILSVKGNVQRNQFKIDYLKTENFFSIFFFFWISGIFIKFWMLSKKSWASQVISYWNYRLEKAELLKSPKNPVSEYLLTVNMLKSRNHCLNLHSSVFVIFFDHSQRELVP